MTMSVTYQKENTLQTFLKSTTVAFIFMQAVSLSAPTVDKVPYFGYEDVSPSFNTKLLNKVNVTVSEAPSFTLSSNPSNVKETKSMEVKQRIKIPLRNQTVAKRGFVASSEEIISHEKISTTSQLEKQRIKIPMRQVRMSERTLIGSEFL